MYRETIEIEIDPDTEAHKCPFQGSLDSCTILGAEPNRCSHTAPPECPIRIQDFVIKRKESKE